MREVQASNARTHLPRLLDAVERGETIFVTRHGRAIARIVPETSSRQMDIDQAVESIKALRTDGTNHRRCVALSAAGGTARLMPFVLDALVAACWAFDDEDHPTASPALERMRTDAAHVPAGGGMRCVTSSWSVSAGGGLPRRIERRFC
jgi:prevent-host-death family protein